MARGIHLLFIPNIKIDAPNRNVIKNAIYIEICFGDDDSIECFFSLMLSYCPEYVCYLQEKPREYALPEIF
jgi:hypothetical protein